MKDLKGYIKEGLFDDLDKIEKVGGLESNANQLKKEITDWITKNSKFRIYKTKLKINFNTTPATVDYAGDIIIDKSATSLTNGNFQWGEVKGSFNCNGCLSLKSLEGAPKVVEVDFICNFCNSLTTLKGAPEKVGRDFYCFTCPLLASLEGAPKEVGETFGCSNCNSLKTLEGAPKVVGRDFYCGRCSSLKSLKGAPEKVGGVFHCSECGTKFTEDDVKKVTDVKYGIYS